MEQKKYLKLAEVECRRIAFHLSNYNGEIIVGCDAFAKNTVGEQFVSAADSISANIAEGFGRYGKRDKIKFYRYSLGSLNACFDWNQKARVRRLVSEKEYEFIFNELQKLPKAINSLFLFTNQKLKAE